MSRDADNLADLPLESAIHVDEICDNFELAFRSGTRLQIEDLVAGRTEPFRSVLFVELLKLDIQLRYHDDSERKFMADDYCWRFPGDRSTIDAIFNGRLESPVPMEWPQFRNNGDIVELANQSTQGSIQAIELPSQFGSYRLESRIGQGGMGVVYLAFHSILERHVALKVVDDQRLQRPKAIARFRREMKSITRLSHPNIVMALGAGEIDGRHFLAMEYVGGLDLSKICRYVGQFPIPVACECIRQAASGLQHIHENGLVHRDIKPSNLMLNEEGQVKLLDLGIARLRDDEDEDFLTSESSPLGTFEYMAPEQARNPHDVDIRADLYSLGCTLFKLICGQSPFALSSRTAIQLLSAHQQTPPPIIRERREDVPHDLEELIQRLLSKAPADRPQTPEEVACVLEKFASQLSLDSFVHRVREVSENFGQSPERGLKEAAMAMTRHQAIAKEAQ